MTKLETDFLDEYKRTDNMIKGAYSCQNGVSEYISMMEKSPGNRAALISSWNADYKMLKHLRWLRNRIAHDTGSTELKASDLDDLKGFRKRFLKGQDPLALSGELKKTSDSKKTSSKASSAGRKADGSSAGGNGTGMSEKKPFPWKNVLIGALAAFVIYMIITYFGSAK